MIVGNLALALGLENPGDDVTGCTGRRPPRPGRPSRPATPAAA
jgi:hypothetical protein